MSRTIFRSILAVAVALIFATPAMAQSKAAIQKLEDQWAAAFNKGDGNAVAALYTEDAYVLPAGADMVHGRDKIAAFYSQAVQRLGDAKVTTTDVLKLGRSAAREIGTVTLKTKGDQPQEMTGKYAAVWRKVDGQWMLETDIWNMNK
jgi:uncharacterized protein (TIGR02246 family)